MREYTDITVLLDRSGSMQTIKEDMETAFNLFIKEHKAVPSTRVTLIQFDDINDQEVEYLAVPVKSVEKLHLRPRGNTPLIDAFCKAIDRTGRRLENMPERERPDQVLFVVITDGQENASTKYKRRNVFDRVTEQREHYKWQFVYLGANQDAIAEAHSYGIPQFAAMNYTPSGAGVRGMSIGTITNTMDYVQNVNRGQAITGFSDEQRKKAEEK